MNATKNKSMHAGRLTYLIQRYLGDQCSQAEKDELKQLIVKADDDMLDRAMEPVWANYAVSKKMPSSEADALLDAVLKKKPAGHRRSILPVSRWWAVAAMVALLFGTGLYFYRSSRHAVDEAYQYLKNDALPGGNKAMLTLSDGSIIALDSAHDGQLARQGASKVIKVDSGLLAYRPQNTGLSPGLPQAYNTLATPRGGQYKIVLADGTKVWLNAASSITYPTAFTGKERMVKVAGEVYLEVARDRSMPFIVAQGNVRIQVLGTHFNVKAYGDEDNMKITLLEGAIKVIQLSTGRAQLVEPGEQVQVSKAGGLKLVKNADTAEAVAWKEGLFRFRNASLQDVLKQMSRWYDVEVVYQAYPDVRLGGIMGRDINLSQAILLLQTNGVHCKIENRKLIIMK